MLESVTAEADGQEEALHAWRPANDGVVIRRERAQSRPASGDPGLLDDGHAVHGFLDGLSHPGPVHRDREIRADVFHVARREQDLLHLLAKVEAAGPVMGEWYGTRDLGKRLSKEDVAAPGLDRHVDPGQASQARRGWPGGVDH